MPYKELSPFKMANYFTFVEAEHQYLQRVPAELLSALYSYSCIECMHILFFVLGVLRFIN
jgi:hypothetical protein